MSADPDMTTEKKQPDNWDSLQEVASVLLKPGVSDQHVTAIYNEWAKNGYDQVRVALCV